ncbi:MAG: hypothetical protein AAGA48_07005 [Myxococcota bacterium]
MRAFAVFSLILAIGCGQDPYIATLQGNWTGTATDANNIQVPAEAQFRYDGEADRPFSGTLDIGGWIYLVNAAASDNASASVNLILNTEARACDLQATVEENSMDATYSIDLCYAQGEGQKNCIETGSLTLTK